ncbi:hypothetical protein SCUP234_10915 [Seiridium cupressi]
MKKFERHSQSQRKHGPLSVSSASKAPAPPPSSRPGWTGPGFVKKAARKPRPSPTPQALTPTVQGNILPVELQQLILDIFRSTFPACHDFAALKPSLRQINEALLRRDLEMAFGSEEFLEGYAIRWSPSRALGYSNLLAQICEQKSDNAWVKRLIGDVEGKPARVPGSPGMFFKTPMKYPQEQLLTWVGRQICFGGGAAEMMAFAGLLRHVRKSAAGKPCAASPARLEDDSPSNVHTPVNLHLVDAADWSSVVSKLQVGVTSPPALSKYASAAARALNASLLSPRAIEVSFERADILDLALEDLRPLLGPEPLLLTLFLTINDLYTTSMRKTTAFLRRLTHVAPTESLLLVVETADAVSPARTVKHGEETMEYSINWLLDKALLPTGEKGEDGEQELELMWERLIEDADVLYRLPEKRLAYPRYATLMFPDDGNGSREQFRCSNILAAAGQLSSTDHKSLLRLSLNQSKRSGVVGLVLAAWQCFPFNLMAIGQSREVLNIFYNNNFALSDELGTRALFPTVARINHSCVPNSQGNFNEILRSFTIHATRSIARGEEVTISYLRDGLALRAARQAKLHAGYDFHCGCELCSGSFRRRKESRERRDEIRLQLMAFARLQGPAYAPEMIVRKLALTRLIIDTYELEGLAGRELASLYSTAAGLAMSLDDHSLAATLGARGLGLEKDAVGHDSPFYKASRLAFTQMRFGNEKTQQILPDDTSPELSYAPWT